MRILHTSDWHLGQNFMGKSREPEHRAFIAWLLDIIIAQRVDAVLIAGDVFDTGTPPSYARKLYNEFIVALQTRANCQLVIVGGNHDSVATLEESRDLLAYLNTTVVGGVATTPEDQLVVLNERDGKPGVILCAIPYIRARDVVQSQAGESQQDKQRALQAGIASHYQTMYNSARQRGDELSPDQPLPIVVTGHLTTVGSTCSESVRDIYIGTLEAFPAEALPTAAHYIALGHLHKPQQVGGSPHIRYSGSPIPLSFDEAGTEKQVVLVDLEDGGPAVITTLAVPRFQAMQVLKGSLASLGEAIDALPPAGDGQTLWLEVEVCEDDYLSDLSQRIETMLEGHAIELLRTRRARKQPQQIIERLQRETLAELSTTDVFERRLQQETLDQATSQALRQAFNDVIAALDDATTTDITANRLGEQRG